MTAAVLLWPLIPVELAPPTHANEIDIELEMARGTNIAVARAYVVGAWYQHRRGAGLR